MSDIKPKIVPRKFNKKDYEIGYALCEACKVNFHTLREGIEAKRIACDLCGSSVVPIGEWDRNVLAVEFLSK
jgi:hypothetical protein